MNLSKTFTNYLFLLLLLSAMLAGAVVGYSFGPRALVLKPLGDIFLNLMFTVVVPLVFFSVASAIANIGSLQRIGKILGSMMSVFLLTSIIAAIFMIFVVKVFPPAQGVTLNLSTSAPMHSINFGEQLVSIFTVPDFFKLFSRESILALIFFSVLIGLATASLGEKAKPIAQLLQAGTDIFMKVVGYVMYYAPIGFFAYFAVLVAELGPKLLESYLRASIIYYVGALIYFIIAYSFYAYLSKPKNGIKLFWQNAILPIMTSLATCSSAASIPANLQATKQIGVPAEIYETVVPLGSIIHKEGSVLGGVIKIAFLFGIYHMDFSGPMVILTVLFVALLVGTVIGAIPSGGMVAELLILSLYGFPPQALIIIAAITLIIDAPATMLNVTGNTVASMLVARFAVGSNWWQKVISKKSSNQSLVEL